MAQKGVKQVFEISKSAQISIFIILGVLVIGAAIVAVFFFKTSSNDNNPIVSPVNNYIQSCAQSTVKDGIKITNFQGGYFNVSNGVHYMFTDVPYYFYLGKSRVPSRSVFELELEKYIDMELPNCINMSEFEKSGYSFEFEKVKSQVSLGKDISVVINYPIKITKNDKTYLLSKFSYASYFNFNKIYSVISKFSDEQNKNPDFMPIGYLPYLAEEEGFTFDITYVNQTEVIYSFVFSDLYSENETTVFNFASKYKWNLFYDTQKKVEIEEIGYHKAFSGREFTYSVKAKGENLKFDDYTNLFDIDPLGNIKFTPTNEEAGTYEILIKAYDSNGNSDTKLMLLDIEKNIEDFNLNESG